MKLVNPKVEIIEENDLFKQIEIAGRVSYKSEDKINENSAASFVERMKKSGHGAVLEHGTVYLKIPYNNLKIINYLTNKYSIVKSDEFYAYITTNYRVIFENNWQDDLEYYMVTEPETLHEKRVMVRFTMDRVGSQSFCRHRVMSFLQESTRFCNYTLDKFSNSISIIKPYWLDNISEDMKNKVINYFNASEELYKNLIDYGLKPEDARAVLPLELKTEIIMTGFVSDWIHFFELRYLKGKPHPEAKYLAKTLYKMFQNKNII